jgi:hypothetical protein
MILIIANVGRQGSRTIAFATGRLPQKQFFWDQSIHPGASQKEMVDVMCHGAAKLGQRWWMSCVMELLNWDGDGGCHVSGSC